MEVQIHGYGRSQSSEISQRINQKNFTGTEHRARPANATHTPKTEDC